MAKSKNKVEKEVVEEKEVVQEEVNEQEAAAEATTEEPKEEQCEADQLKEQLNTVNDKHLRLQAEFDNFRRRTQKEKLELIKSAGEKILVDVLPVIDDFERALQSMQGEDEATAAMKQGVELIYNRFSEFMKQNGVTEIEAMEKEFDTDVHEALTKIPAPSEELKGKVVDVIQKGYMLNDKVIRFAKVVIGE
ncbi:nucleotide exchange factor GrpE [Prolixibacteraceae bacterium JC049]|nr:nucleotide exchange factor GrpE [Prolixibacteraceae bacterium JC049]